VTDTAKTVPSVDLASRSDPGRDPDKQVNEDVAAHLDTRLGLLAVVCDGMGGHAGGKEAADLAVATILERVQHAPDDATPTAALRAAIEEANQRVWTMPTKEPGLRPGSTVVAVLMHSGGAEVAHVGDSRVYLVHAGAISQLTRDHSMVQEMVDRNIIRAEDAASHPDANKILRALGIAKDVDVDVRAEPIAYVAGDVFVLCSDGLSDLVGPADILQIAGAQPPAQAAGQLVDLANARGGHDNVTVLVLRAKSTAEVESDAKATLVKTVALTQAEAAPSERRSGPRGTVLAEPVARAAAPPPAPTPVAIPPAPPPAVTSFPPPSAAGRPRIAVVLAIALGLCAIGIAVFLVWWAHKPKHVAVPIVDLHEGGSAIATTTLAHDDDAAAPVITPAPTLQQEPAVCAKARLARDRGSPAAATLEAQCRAAGGVIPSASGSSVPTPPTPAPTPSPTPVPSVAAPAAVRTAEPIVCAEARAARASGAANAAQLEARCRASGGTP
jgi:serine/threonine protein phosphatase PrpC